MKRIDNQTFYHYSFLSNVKANEQGTHAVFVRHTPDKEKNKYHANLFLYHDQSVQQLTSCDSVGEFFWQDNQTIIFSSKRTEEHYTPSSDNDNTKEPTVMLYKKSISQITEATHLLTLKGHISNIQAISEKQLIYIKTRDIIEADSPYFAEQKNKDDMMRIRKLPFYFNNAGYIFNKRSMVCVYNIDTKEETEINCKDYSIDQYTLSKDKHHVLMTGTRLQKRTSRYTALFEYHLQTSELQRLLDDQEKESSEAYSISLATYFNQKPFFLGSTMKKHGLNENQIAYTIQADGTVNALHSNDISYLNSGVQDMVYAGGKSYKVFDDHIDFITTNGIMNNISRLKKDGSYEEGIYTFEGGISCFDYVDNGILLIGLSAEGGQEIYFNDKKISSFHQFLTDYYVADVQVISLKSTGYDIDGFVLLPEDYHKKDQHPAVLEIHGGPKAAYQVTYFHEMQMLAGEGYVVMYCNPRGSSGKGNDFFDIFGSYGKVDYQNIMDFTDIVCQTYDKIDPNRLFVTGGSYGGYMTNHIVGQTNRFKAAVTQRCISNWTSMYGTSDIGYYFCPDQHRTHVGKETFWQDLWDVSPLKNIDYVKTPTLIIHSDQDYRCPLEQGYQFFNALIDRGIDTELLVFKNENHELSRGGKPNNRVERLEAIKNWFARYNQ